MDKRIEECNELGLWLVREEKAAEPAAFERSWFETDLLSSSVRHWGPPLHFRLPRAHAVLAQSGNGEGGEEERVYV